MIYGGDNLYLFGILFALFTVIVGIILQSKFFWNLHKFWAFVMSIMVGTSIGLLIFSRIDPIILSLIIFIQIYRLFSFLRLVASRLNTEQLRARTIRSELALNSFLLFVVAIWSFDYYFAIPAQTNVFVLASVQLLFCLVLIRHFKYIRLGSAFKFPKKLTADVDLPSLTVALPARNETKNLNECLKDLLQSDYPKLEILVLDDCSLDSTPDIIRDFAHRGVRFVEGKTPPKGWLAKNYAYQQLLDEAEGKYIIFCGVDTHFDKKTHRLLIETLINNRLSMLSVLPTRSHKYVKSFFLQPMRYWNELFYPKFFKQNLPVLSTCWLIDKKILKNFGGFSGYKNNIRPEQLIAEKVAKDNRYKFLFSFDGLGLYSTKGLGDQWQTALRGKYPELKNRPENVLVRSLFLLFIVFSPFFMFVQAIVFGWFYVAILCLLSILILLYMQFCLNLYVFKSSNLIWVLFLPLMIIMEVIVVNYSMWAYEFSKVIWKGRNICMPVLRAYPKLPKVDM